jgi:hypothetical protein
LPSRMAPERSLNEVNCDEAELGDDELYPGVPGKALASTLDKLETVVAANAELEESHEQRKATLTA